MKNNLSKFKIKHDHIIVQSNNHIYDIDGGIVDLPRIKVATQTEKIILYEAEQDRMLIEQSLIEKNEDEIFNFTHELLRLSLYSNGDFLPSYNETILINLTYDFLKHTAVVLDLQPLNRQVLTQFLNDISIFLNNLDIELPYAYEEDEREAISLYTLKSYF